MELFAVMFGMSVLAMTLLAAMAALLYPLFWIWMLVDAIVRDPAEYPNGGENEKVVWAVLVAVAHPVCILYFFLVVRKRQRTATGAPVAQHAAGPACS